MESWKNGKMGKPKIATYELSFLPIIPAFQYSIIPVWRRIYGFV
jgi:hypothetical protein